MLDTISTSTSITLPISTTSPTSGFDSSTGAIDFEVPSISTVSMRAISFGSASSIFSTVSTPEVTAYLPILTSNSLSTSSIPHSIDSSTNLASIRSVPNSYAEAKPTSSFQVVDPVFSNLKTNPVAMPTIPLLLATTTTTSKSIVEVLKSDSSPTPTSISQDSTRNLPLSPSPSSSVQLNVQLNSFFSSKSSGVLSHCKCILMHYLEVLQSDAYFPGLQTLVLPQLHLLSLAEIHLLHQPRNYLSHFVLELLIKSLVVHLLP